MHKRVFFVATCVLILALNVGALAQSQGIPYRMSDKDVERLMRRIKKDTDRFRKSLDAALDRSHFNGTSREDDINAFVKDFDHETGRLHDRFKDHKSVSADVETVLDRASRINRFMLRHELSPKAQRDWSAVRTDLDQLAQAYNVTWNW
jgi:hypothetical protein